MEGIEHKEKPIDTVAKVILLMIVGSDTVLKSVAELAFAIPVVGQILFVFATLFTVIAWATILFYFVMKLGLFGSAGLAMTIGGVLSTLGLPVGLLVGTILAIYFANHPKVAAVAALATGKVGGAEKAAGEEVAAGAVAAGEKAAMGIEEANERMHALADEIEETGRGMMKRLGETTETPGAPEAPKGKPSETPVGKPSEVSTERKPEELSEEKKPEVSEEALGGELEPEKELERELVGGGKTGLEVPQQEKKNEPEEEDEDEELPKAA